MIILHPTNNLITRILIGEKQVELLNPQVPPSKSHRILRGSSSRPLNKEYIRAELAFSPSSEKWPGNTFLDVKSRLESIARIGLLKKNDLEVACGR